MQIAFPLKSACCLFLARKLCPGLCRASGYSKEAFSLGSALQRRSLSVQGGDTSL